MDTRFGDCPHALRSCPFGCIVDPTNDSQVVPNDSVVQKYEPWCLTVECRSCSGKWYACARCDHALSHIITLNQLKRHATRYHNEKKYRCHKRKAKEEEQVPNKKSRVLEVEYATNFYWNIPTFQYNEGGVQKEKDNQDEEQAESVTYNEGGGWEEEAEEQEQQEIDTVQQLRQVTDDDIIFEREESIRFFKNELKQENGGARSLVAQSFYKDNIDARDIPDEDVTLCLQMTALVHVLSTRQISLFGAFMKLLMYKFNAIKRAKDTLILRNSGNYCTKCNCMECTKWRNSKQPEKIIMPVMPPLPASEEHIRAAIVSGRDAFLPNLPHPEIHKVTNHSFTYPSECIRHWLATGNVPAHFSQLENLESYKFPWQTPRGVELAQKMHELIVSDPGIINLQIAIIHWSDDAEASFSNRTSVAGSLWIYSITIFPKERVRDSPRATFPIIIGPKLESHDLALKLVGEDLKKMETNRLRAFIGRSKSQKRKPRPVSFCTMTFVYLADQPERRGINSLQAGNSRVHGRWLVAGDHWKLKEVLPACEDCLKIMKQADSLSHQINWKVTTGNCEKCTNWVNRNLDCPQLKHFAGTKFPKGFLVNGNIAPTQDQMVNPIRLTYQILQYSVKLAHDQIFQGNWTKAETLKFLYQCGLNTKYRTHVVNRAFNRRERRLAYESGDQVKIDKIEQDRMANPRKYKRAGIPAMWRRDILLEIFIDTPMHLLFLGICKSIFQKVSEWCGRCGRKAAFTKVGKSLLQDLANLKLSWLSFNVKTFDTWAGWNAEKYHSLTRVAVWVYGPLLVIDEEEPYKEPRYKRGKKLGKLKAPNDWTVPEYKEWLRVRGMDTTGNQADVKPRVINALNLPKAEQPQPLPVGAQFGTAEGVLTMIMGMVLLVSTAMQPKIDGKVHADILDLRVRLFLSAVEAFDTPQRETRKNKKPLWLRRFNFLSLLNIAWVIEYFGSFRDLYEGKYRGESYVKEVKNTRARFPPVDVYHNVMKKLHQGKMLDCIIEMYRDGTLKSYRQTDISLNKKRELAGNVRVYKSKNDVILNYHANKPMSLVITDKGEFAVLFYKNGCNRGIINYLKMRQVDNRVEHHRLRYWRWNLGKGAKKFSRINEIKDYGVLLPRVGVIENDRVYHAEYTIVTKEWSPMMFEHHGFSKAGLVVKRDEKPTVDVSGRAWV